MAYSCWNLSCLPKTCLTSCDQNALYIGSFIYSCSGWTMSGSKRLVRTELQQSGCWDVVPKCGSKVSTAGITTTTDSQRGPSADTRSRQSTPQNPASCTEGSTTWVGPESDPLRLLSTHPLLNSVSFKAFCSAYFVQQKSNTPFAVGRST